MAQLIFAKDTNESKRLSALMLKGKLNRIRSGIYTDASIPHIPELIQQRWFEVVEYLVQDPVAAFRTAVELKPVEGQVFIVSSISSRKKYAVTDSLTVNVIPGDVENLIEPFVPGVSRSSLPRQLLENLMPSRTVGGINKALGRQWVEEKLCHELSIYGEKRLNEVRDLAKDYAEKHGLNTEFTELSNVVSAIFATHPAEGFLKTSIAIATAAAEPFDQDRVKLFEKLYQYLSALEFDPISFDYNQAAWRNLSFFESYFSNFIEGTEFLIEEAEEIVFSEHLIDGRHEDSHDVLSVYNLVSDYQEMINTPETPDEYLQLMQERHRLIMGARKEKQPGVFKKMQNKAGSSIFVSPENLIGTLTQGFQYYLDLPKGLSRAIYMHFLTVECHPFNDGNGRLSRIMMNSELVASEQCKIIMPTVHRDSYLNGLRQGTRQGLFRTLVKVFYQMQCYTSAIDWIDYGEARAKIEHDKADLIPDDGIATFNATIRQYKKNFPAN